MEPVIRTTGLTKSYGRDLALDGLDLVVPSGGIHGLVGANGAGKTTLLRVLLGFIEATAGQAYLLGQDSRALTHKDRARVAFVDGEHCLPGSVRVGRLVDMWRRQHRSWDDAIFRTAISGCGLADRQSVGELSRGQHASLNLALNLARMPALLLLDEPTLGLDLPARRRFLEILLYSEALLHATVVYCSHHVDEVERVSDGVIVLTAGRVRFQGPPEDLCHLISYWVSDIPFKGPGAAEVPGLLQSEVIEGVHHHVLLGESAAFPDILRRHGARTIRRKGVDLEMGLKVLMTAGDRPPPT